MYQLDVAMLEGLKPDLILTQDLCDVCAVSYERVNDAVGLIDLDTSVMSLEARTIDGILDTVDAVAALTGTEGRAAEIRADAERRLAALPGPVPGAPTVLFVEWLDPLMPGGHWVLEQITYAGGRSLLLGPGAHSTPHLWSVVADLAPEVVVFGPCGFTPERTVDELSVATAQPGWADMPAVRQGQVGWSTGLPTSTALARGSSTARRSSPASSAAVRTPALGGCPSTSADVAAPEWRRRTSDADRQLPRHSQTHRGSGACPRCAGEVDDPVAPAVQQGLVVGDDQDPGLLGPLVVADDGGDVRLGGGVEHRGGLVAEQVVGAVYEGPGEAGALQLPVGHRVGPSGAQVGGEADEVGEFGHPLPDRDSGVRVARSGSAIRSARLSRGSAAARGLWKRTATRVRRATGTAYRTASTGVPSMLTWPWSGRCSRARTRDQCRLAAAGRPPQSDRLAPADAQVDAVEDDAAGRTRTVTSSASRCWALVT